MFDIMSLFRPQQPGNMLASAGQPQPQAPNMLAGMGQGLQQFGQSQFGQRLGDMASGWAMGSNPSDSFAQGGRMVAIGNERRRGSTNQNQTVDWLKSQGMDEQQARAIASNPPVLSEYLKQMLGKNDPNADLDRRYKEAQIGNIESQIDERKNPSVRDQFGLNPIYGKDADGNLVVMQPSKAGGLVKADIPEGVSLQPGTDKIDLGTAWGITDRSGAVISVIPKDVAGEAAASAGGKVQGETAANLPSAETGFNNAMQTIDQLLTHPGLESSVGTVQGHIPDWMAGMANSDVADFRNRLGQAQGKAFLEAFQSLKGGGAITEVEGKKAEQALARLNQAVDEKDFKQALMDFRQALVSGQAALRRKAGVASPAEQPAPASGPQPDGVPSPGAVVDGYRFKGGNPADPNSWEPAQ